MNRNDEYKALLDEISETPLKLDYTFERAQARRTAHKRRSRKAVFAPIISIAAVFAVFVLLVNVSPTFAYAAGRILLLRDLAQFVAMSPSLSAAVENEYVQPMGLEQTSNGVTARIEYVIVDQKQLNIFYSLSSDDYSQLLLYPEILDAEGNKLEGYGGLNTNSLGSSGVQRKITANFTTGTMPKAVMLKVNVEDGDKLRQAGNYFYEPDYIAEFTFILSFDPNFTSAGTKTELNKTFDLDDQELTLTSTEIYPTHMRFSLVEDESNTARLITLDFYVENENGDRFGSIGNHYTPTSITKSSDNQNTVTFSLESPYFSDSKCLTLHITGVSWLDKNAKKMHIDLASKTADSLPQDVVFEMAAKTEDGWELAFSAPLFEEDDVYSIWNSMFFDSEGKLNSFTGKSSMAEFYYDISRGANVNLPGRFIEHLNLTPYPYDDVWLYPEYTSLTQLDKPLNIKIK